ncbi:MAG TPA: ATP-binding protein, partial [Roseiflexaceae bacterium]|nr:ATP-binding protein [Roseiflexaceae bacterium]
RAALAREISLPVIFRTVVEAIVETFGYTQVSLYMLESDMLALQHQIGYEHVIARIPITSGVSGRVVRTRQPVLLEDVRSDPAFLGAIDGIVSEICVPLFDDGRIAGILNVETVDGVQLSHSDLQLMIAVGEHVDIAIWRARLFAEAREHASILRAFYDSATIMMGVVAVVDDDILHLSDNAASASFFGRTPEAMRNRFASHLGVPAASVRFWIEQYRASAASNRPVCFEYAHEDHTGARWLAATVSPIAQTLGDRQCFSYVVDDVTKRKQIERLKNELIAIVSHELRTPMTSIYGSLSLLTNNLSGNHSTRTQTMIDIAFRNSERLVRLLNDMLDSEKIESGRLDFHFRRVALAPVLEQAIELSQGFADQFGIRLRLLQVAPDIFVHVDTDRLMQILTNLLSNAIKFSPRGQPVVVSAERVAPNVRISVVDQGPGIPPEFQLRIFEKFLQADSSDTRRRSGTGLGLSISKALAEKLGGQISFITHHSVGTTFY